MITLKEHLSKNNVVRYFGTDADRETINIIYGLMKAASNANADTLNINKVGWYWSKDNNILYETKFALGFQGDKRSPTWVWGADQRSIHKILDTDPIVPQYVRIVKETEDEIVLEFVDPAAPTE